jgi:hypothetical protein
MILSHHIFFLHLKAVFFTLSFQQTHTLKKLRLKTIPIKIKNETILQ